MPGQYKIAVLGPIPHDHITTYKGKEFEKYGGITHPVVVLSRLLGESSRIIPVTHIRKADENAIHELLSDWPGVDLSLVNSDANQGDVIRLRFLDKNERAKIMTAFMNPITPDDVKNLLDCDAFVCTPVTDFEITFETLRFIKQHSDAKIIFDAHGQTKTMTILGDRLLKFWVDRDRWLPYIDVLKMNLEEVKCCWFKKRYTLEQLEDNEKLDMAELPAFAKHCFKKGLKALYITLAEQGCLVYYMQDDELKEELVPSVMVETVVDSTGCGDAFAGGLTFGLLTTNNYIKAAQYANTIGAQCSLGTNFEAFRSLDETKQMIKETYGGGE